MYRIYRLEIAYRQPQLRTCRSRLRFELTSAGSNMAELVGNAIITVLKRGRILRQYRLDETAGHIYRAAIDAIRAVSTVAVA